MTAKTNKAETSNCAYSFSITRQRKIDLKHLRIAQTRTIKQRLTYKQTEQ